MGNLANQKGKNKRKEKLRMKNLWKVRKHARNKWTCKIPSLEVTDVIEPANRFVKECVISSENAIVEGNSVDTIQETVPYENAFLRPLNTESSIVTEKHEDEITVTDEEVFSGEENLPDLFTEPSNTNEKTDFVTVEGRRIVDMNYFLEQIKQLSRHEPFNCTFSDMYIIKEHKVGFISAFTFRCKMCNLTKTIQTEDSEVSYFNVNEAAVMARIMTGSGYAHMEETAATLNMPCMSKGYYHKLQNKVYDNIHTVAWQQMRKAAEKESAIAIEEGNVDSDGIPCITVIVDGSWGKRSYNMNCTSMVGMACIIGQATNEVLYLAIRNKYCCICAKTEADNSAGSSQINHICYKNWNGSSSAMEADIIAEGFRLSRTMYNIKYTRIVGDGDSSVMEKLRTQLPYGPETEIEKIECTNHLLRNFGKKMRAIYNKTSNAKGNVPKNVRRIIESKDQNIRTGIISAIKYRGSQKDIPFNQRTILLKSDILNVPKHCLGVHTECANYFCSKQEDCYVAMDQLKFFGVWDDILCAINSLAYHSKSLLHCTSNNAAEQFNSIVSKFIAGKRINYSYRRSYISRCEAAAISYNVGYDKHVLLQSVEENSKLGKFTQTFVTNQKNQRHKRIERRHQRQQLRKKDKLTLTNESHNIHYGPNAATGNDSYQSDLCPELIEIRKTEFLNQLAEANREEIEKATQLQRESPRWFVERRKRLTASKFGRIYKLQNKTPRGAAVAEMINPSFRGNIHTEYGNSREPIAIEEVEQKLRIKIKKSGLIIDENFPFLAASPDGLIDENGMVEVKCPPSAQNHSPEDAAQNVPNVKKWCSFLNGEMKLNMKHDYYFQVQGQLHIAQREYCLFVFWTPKGVSIQKIFRDSKFWEEKMIDRLIDFYMNHYLLELIDSRIERQLPVRNSRVK